MMTRTYRGVSFQLAKLLVFILAASWKLAPLTADQPNFVFIQGEGQGWASTSVQLDPDEPGSKSNSFSTPNLERLAREGIRFSNYYAPSPRCTPSRATYFTGLSPALLHMTFTAAGGDTGGKVIEPRVLQELPTTTRTIAEILKDAGYATAHFGKWHVGRADPRVHGFDESDGATSNAGPENSANPNPKQAYGMAKRGIIFIERQAKAGRPFYLQLSQYGGRSEADAMPETFERVLRLGLGRDDRSVGAAAVALDMDITIGRVLDTLDQLGIANNTYVIYTADHGTPGRNGPLQGGKGGLWDGGLRIPLLIRGPGAAAEKHCGVRVTGADLVPTIADLAGATDALPREVEGGSLKQLLADPQHGIVARPRDEVVFHFPHYDKDPLGPVSAIIVDNFKLIRIYENDSYLLFDLSKDIGERNDLSGSHGDKVRELSARLTSYLDSVDAGMPVKRSDNDAPSSTASRNRKANADAIMQGLDKNVDGRLTADEIERLPALLRSLDKNKDGTLSRDETRGR